MRDILNKCNELEVNIPQELVLYRNSDYWNNTLYKNAELNKFGILYNIHYPKYYCDKYTGFGILMEEFYTTTGFSRGSMPTEKVTLSQVSRKHEKILMYFCDGKRLIKMLLKPDGYGDFMVTNQMEATDLEWTYFINQYLKWLENFKYWATRYTDETFKLSIKETSQNNSLNWQDQEFEKRFLALNPRKIDII